MSERKPQTPEVNRKVANTFCESNGHNIQSYTVGHIVLPGGANIVNKYEMRCSQCGLTVDQILNYKVRSAKSKKEETNGGSC